MVLKHRMQFIPHRFKQILKFHERVISALILVAIFARFKISSQLLRVNGILKFEKIQKFIYDTFTKKKRQSGLEFCFVGPNCMAEMKFILLYLLKRSSACGCEIKQKHLRFLWDETALTNCI